MIYYIDPVTGYGNQISVTLIWSILGVVVAILLAMYLLRSFGVYKLAKTKQVKNPWLAFIPLAWSFTIGKVVDDTAVFFGRRIKKFATWFCVIFSVSNLLAIAYFVIVYGPLIGYFLQGYGKGAEIWIANSEAAIQAIQNKGLVEYGFQGMGVFTKTNFVFPYGAGFKIPFYILQILSNIMDLVNIVFEITMFTAVFKKFWPRQMWSATIFSIFGLFPIFVFVIRNKQEVKPEDLFRNAYGNPYNNPYANMTNQNTGASKSEPFSEFGGGSNSDPFSEFSSNKNQNDDEPFSEFGDDNK